MPAIIETTFGNEQCSADNEIDSGIIVLGRCTLNKGNSDIITANTGPVNNELVYSQTPSAGLSCAGMITVGGNVIALNSCDEATTLNPSIGTNEASHVLATYEATTPSFIVLNTIDGVNCEDFNDFGYNQAISQGDVSEKLIAFTSDRCLTAPPESDLLGTSVGSILVDSSLETVTAFETEDCTGNEVDSILNTCFDTGDGLGFLGGGNFTIYVPPGVTQPTFSPVSAPVPDSKGAILPVTNAFVLLIWLALLFMKV